MLILMSGAGGFELGAWGLKGRKIRVGGKLGKGPGPGTGAPVQVWAGM